MQKHYVIGDVHGEYQTLLALVAKLPKDAKLIFVGDLIDRGSQSKEVVAFVRDNNHQTVMGNHEGLFCRFALEFLSYLDGERSYDAINQRWHKSGRFETFLSYGVVDISKDGEFSIVHDSRVKELLRDDVEWMRRNPIYKVIDTTHASGKKVVVSHSNISQVWHIRNDTKRRSEFQQTTLWTRDHTVYEDANIFNIFGHHPQKFKPDITKNYANVDTGCCYALKIYNLYGRLSAYCIETEEIIMQKTIKNKEKK